MIPVHVSTVGGYQANIISLSNEHLTAVVTDLGARLLELHAPGSDGAVADVVLGRPDLTSALADPNYMGSTAGRYANRIRRGQFQLDGTTYQVATNEGLNHLHGGDRGFDRHAWSTQVHHQEQAVTFTRVSPDGEEGFPGALAVATRYTLRDHTLQIRMTGTTDVPTVVNLVHHSYFNLAGHLSGPVLDHTLQVHAAHYTPVDGELLPTGEIRAVTETAFDFRAPKRIGEHLGQVRGTGAGRVAEGAVGYDHNLVLDRTGMGPVAVLTDPGSGRRLELSTDQRGLHLYTGGYLAGVTAKTTGSPQRYEAFAGLTLETQTFPDAVNVAHFPSPVLLPSEEYVNTMELTFSIA